MSIAYLMRHTYHGTDKIIFILIYVFSVAENERGPNLVADVSFSLQVTLKGMVIFLI